MGITAICTYLNGLRHRMRGKPFYTLAVERVLKSETYIGTAYFNREDSRTLALRAESEWIRIPVPPIVTR